MSLESSNGRYVQEGMGAWSRVSHGPSECDSRSVRRFQWGQGGRVGWEVVEEAADTESPVESKDRCGDQSHVE